MNNNYKLFVVLAVIAFLIFVWQFNNRIKKLELGASFPINHVHYYTTINVESVKGNGNVFGDNNLVNNTLTCLPTTSIV